MHDQFTEIRDLFLAALERDGVDAQLHYAQEQCAEKPQIHAKLVDMLKAHHQKAGFLASGVDSTHNMPSSIEPAGTRFGPYKVRELLGEGGMGNVYVAKQEEPVRRKVALKIIKPGMDSRQVITLDIDTRSDVYSLGVLMYELITGITPFDGEMLKRVGFDEMRRLIREQDPPRPSERLSTVKKHSKTRTAPWNWPTNSAKYPCSSMRPQSCMHERPARRRTRSRADYLQFVQELK